MAISDKPGDHLGLVLLVAHPEQRAKTVPAKVLSYALIVVTVARPSPVLFRINNVATPDSVCFRDRFASLHRN